jgi:hypothetical protein
MGQLFIAVDGDHIPAEAKPLQCALECKGAKDPLITVDGSSMGPFKISMSAALADVNRKSETGTSCLLEVLKVHVKQISGFDYIAHSPSPLVTRCEAGGCELQRLALAPLELGVFKILFPPSVRFSLITSCCGCGFAGATATLLDHSSTEFDESGKVEIKRKRELHKEVCDLVVQVDKVPLNLLPGGSMRFPTICKPMDRISLDLRISCLVFVYWTPPEDSEDESADGLVWMACDVEHLPAEVLPVEGRMYCQGAETGEYILDGTQVGPFLVQEIGSGSGKCLLSGVSLEVSTPPEGFKWRARDPPPFEERWNELGGCELQRLAILPQVVGYFTPLPPPPLELAVRTTCCDRCYTGATVAFNELDGIELDSREGTALLRRKRGQVQNEVEINGVPAFFLPEGNTKHTLSTSPWKEAHLSLDVACLVWVYWVPPEPPEEDEEEGESDDEPMEGTLFVAADPEQIPDEALPISCSISCPGAEEMMIYVDGTSMGPFAIRAADRKSIGDYQDTCLLANMQFLVPCPPEGYRWRSRFPSPLAERTQEFGGCELTRLISVPQAMGFLKPVKKGD